MKNKKLFTCKKSIALVLSVIMALPSNIAAFAAVNTDAEPAESMYEFVQMEGAADDGLEAPGSDIIDDSELGEDIEAARGDDRYYCAMDDELVNPARNQGSTGMCWAFSVASCIESNAIKLGAIDKGEMLISPEATAYYFFNRAVDAKGLTEGTTVAATNGDNYKNSGGNGLNTVFELMQWITPANEEDFPFDSAVHTYPTDVENAYDKDVFHLRNAVWTRSNSIDSIKYMVKNYGSAYVNVRGNILYVTTSYDGEELPVFKGATDKIETAYYCGSETGIGHAVTIVGWDDTISTDCFNGYASGKSPTGNKPANKGAWIVKNSYTDHPYFYISYEDNVLKNNTTNKAVAYAVENLKKDFNNYGYDGGIGTHTVGVQGKLYGASVFTASASADGTEGEIVKSAAFATNTAGLNYKVRVYTNLKKGDDGVVVNPTDGVLCSTASGSTTLPGYYTVDFPDSVKVREGSLYSIVVELTKSSSASNDTPNAGVTFMYDDKYGGLSGDWVSSRVTAVRGRSFLSKDGFNFTDTYNAPSVYSDVNTTRTPASGYVRIKAFTINSDDAGEKLIDSDMVADVADQTYTGSQITPEPVVCYGNVLLERDIDYTVTYGRNVSVGSGSGSVTIKGIGQYKTKSAIVKNFSILPRDIDSQAVSANCPQQIPYTGKAIEPVTLSFNGVYLKKNTDYTISYSQNINTGTGIAKITGKGNYKGRLTLKFDIVRRDINDSGINIKLPSAQAYTGSQQTPAVTITSSYISGGALIENKDYTVQYEDNVLPGIAKITVTGAGRYQGSRVVNFSIKQASIKDCSMAAIPAQTYTGAFIVPDINLTYKGTKLVESIDYTASYINNIEAGTATVTIVGKPGTIYAGTMRSENFVINPANLSTVTFENFGDLTYTPGKSVYTQNTNEETEKALRIRFPNGLYLDPSEYTVTYSGNRSTGAASVTATMTVAANSPNITGRITKNFKIISSGKILLNDYTDPNLSIKGFAASREYILDTTDLRENADNAIKPGLSLYYKGKRLTEGTDYTVAYENNKKIGTGTVTITAAAGSDYAGTRVENFYIIGKPIYSRLDVPDNDFTVSEPSECVYNGGLQEPKITVTEKIKRDADKGGSGSRFLSVGKDYILRYVNNVEVGTASIVLEGIGEYSGTHTFEFEILPAEISDIRVEGLKSMVYTGERITPDIYLRNKGRYLIEGADYDLVYGENVSTGKGSITYAAREDQVNYIGEKTVFFDIKPRALKDGAIVVENIGAVEYTGYQITPEIKMYIMASGEKVEIPDSEYELVYGTNKNVGTGTVLIKAKSTKLGGSGNFTGSRRESFKITGVSLNVEALEPEDAVVTYSGKKVRIKPATLTTVDGDVLYIGKDYMVRTDKRVNSGTGICTIVGKGDYKGAVTHLPYTIKPVEADESNVVIKDIKPLEFASEKTYLKPDLKVFVGKKKLVKNRDYVVTFKNNNVRGVATAYIYFVGNYQGKAVKTFEIE